MVSRASIPPHDALKKPPMDTEWGVFRVDIPLNKGRVGDALRVFNGPVAVTAMFMEITEAVADTACNMSWVFDSDKGGKRTIGDTVNIQAAALGDFFWAELDGTNIVAATTSTGLIFNGYDRRDANGTGMILTSGGIDIVLGTNNLASGKGTLYVVYKPLVPSACIFAEDWQTSTTTSTTTSSTSSTASTTSSTSSTASTTSSTSSTASTTSTTSTASTTSSTSSTASTTSSTSSTASTTSTAGA